MIPSQEVQEPVSEEHGDLLEDVLAVRQGLFAGGRNADYDVAEEVTRERTELAFVHREREHVGGPILSAIDLVQLMNSIIVS